MTELPFDHVEVCFDSGAKDLSVAQFREIRLNRRVRLLVENRVTFFKCRDVVPPGLALKSLAEQRARELGR